MADNLTRWLNDERDRAREVDALDECASGMTSAAYMLGAALLCGVLFVVAVVLLVRLR